MYEYSAVCLCTWYPQRSEEGAGSPGVKNGEPTCGCWKWNPGPLQEQVLLTGNHLSSPYIFWDRGFHSVAKASLGLLVILLPQLPKCWDHMCTGHTRWPLSSRIRYLLLWCPGIASSMCAVGFLTLAHGKLVLSFTFSFVKCWHQVPALHGL